MTSKIPDQEFEVARNVRNKKNRNPGFESGNHWIQCDKCACAIRASDARKEWTGLWVCPDDWEQRHPQDFVRGRVDEIAAAEPNRPEGTDQFVDRNTLPDLGESVIPPGTNNNSL